MIIPLTDQIGRHKYVKVPRTGTHLEIEILHPTPAATALHCRTRETSAFEARHLLLAMAVSAEEAATNVEPKEAHATNFLQAEVPPLRVNLMSLCQWPKAVHPAR